MAPLLTSKLLARLDRFVVADADGRDVTVAMFSTITVLLTDTVVISASLN